MAFFDELSKKAQAYAGVAVEKARDLADTASEKARAAADSAKISMAISTEQREMEKNYRAIGEWFVSEYEGEIPDAVKDVVAAVLASKEKIAELEASKPKKEDAPEDVIEVEPMAETEKTCPVCGVKSDSKFCPECGAPMGEQYVSKKRGERCSPLFLLRTRASGTAACACSFAALRAKFWPGMAKI